MKWIQNFFVILVACCWMVVGDDKSETSGNSLQLVQVLYRHGDRNIVHPYPTDPYSDTSFWPGGLGELTNIGKMQQYYVGIFLRERYKDFLPAQYLPDDIYVRSSDVDRTLASAMSNLAGLFPPEGNQTWNPDIEWQPIPVHTVPVIEDYLLRMESDCPRFNEELEKVKLLPELVNIDKQNKALYKYLENHTGEKVTGVRDVNYLYDTLFIEDLKGHKLPNWTGSVFPDKMAPLYHFSFAVPVFNKELQRLRGGPLLKEMLQHMSQKRNGSLLPDRKMFMYSGHDTSVAPFLKTVGLFDPPVAPPYAAMVMVELYKNNQDEYTVKMLYRNDSGVDPYVLTIPGCKELCPLDQLEEILRPVIPVDIKEECMSQKEKYLFYGITFWAILLTGIFVLVLFLSLVLGLIYWKKKKAPAYWYLKLDTDDSLLINGTA